LLTVQKNGQHRFCCFFDRLISRFFNKCGAELSSQQQGEAILKKAGYNPVVSAGSGQIKSDEQL